MPMESTFPILSTVTFLPLVGIVVLMLVPGRGLPRGRWAEHLAGAADDAADGVGHPLDVDGGQRAGEGIHDLLPSARDGDGRRLPGAGSVSVLRPGLDRYGGDPGGDPVLALPGICRGLRHQGADVASAFLAARCPRRGAD